MELALWHRFLVPPLGRRACRLGRWGWVLLKARLPDSLGLTRLAEPIGVAGALYGDGGGESLKNACFVIEFHIKFALEGHFLVRPRDTHRKDIGRHSKLTNGVTLQHTSSR